MWPQMTSLLSPWQWVILALVPPAVVALYFLKLKRTPLEVPSTYLWKKSIEDLHVNSLWQRLRRSILLLLQLLLLLLLLLALLNFSWQSSAFAERRVIYLIDNSASMQTKDIAEGARSRLDEAKRLVAARIDEMRSGDVAMIISFNERAQVVQQYTGNRPELRRQLANIRPTNRPTSIDDALRLASALANPGRTSNTDEGDVVAADAVPADLVVLSDFRFPPVADFALGNLEPKLEMLGAADTSNLAIVNFSTARHESRPDLVHIFARLQNYAEEEQSVRAELLLDDFLIDAKEVAIGAGGFVTLDFTREDVETGVLELRVAAADALTVDNRAWTVINRPQRRRILFVSPGNTGLRRALESDAARELAQVEQAEPPYLNSPEYKAEAASGRYDLIIYDECAPEKLPFANTLFINALPPDGRWTKQEELDTGIQIIDTERTHPLMKLLDLGDVMIYQGFVVKRPSGGVNLIDSSRGPIFAVAPRDGYEDAVIGFSLMPVEENGELYPNTNWPRTRSFPVFIREVLTYLAGVETDTNFANVRPGGTFALRNEAAGDELTVVDPAKKKQRVRRNRQNTYEFADTQQVGVYEVWDDDRLLARFAVNLFSQPESDNRTRPEESVRLGHEELAAQSALQPSRREIWKWLVVLGLVVLLAEWYIYNRRVYL
ncbi:MAG: VWA domain-containing protein [Planctomycetota bacterium]|nr:MAG: VWA domain-containing protein [Planctomycetota bacterium]